MLVFDEHPGMSHTRFPQWGGHGFAVSHAGADRANDLAAMVSPDRMIVVLPLRWRHPRKTASDRFCALEPRRAGGYEIPTANWPWFPCNASERRLGGTLSLTNDDSLGWRILEVSLRSAMRRG